MSGTGNILRFLVGVGVSLGRMVSPEEVARAVRFLASENASAITGVNPPVDCRWLVTPPRHTYGGSVQRADDGACAASAEAQGGARMVSSMSPIGQSRNSAARAN